MTNGMADLNKTPCKLTTAMQLKGKLIEGIIEQKNEISNFAADNFADKFNIPKITDGNYPTIFPLTHKPIGEIIMYINSFRYNDECFSYDKDTNTVTWTFTSDKEGFDISDMDIEISYDYDREKEK